MELKSFFKSVTQGVMLLAQGVMLLDSGNIFSQFFLYDLLFIITGQ